MFGDHRQYNYLNINSGLWNAFVFSNDEIFNETWKTNMKTQWNIHVLLYKCIDNKSRNDAAYILGIHDYELPDYVLTKAASQFIIHRSTIHQRPLSYWRKLLNKLYLLGDRANARGAGYPFEFFFFCLFTGFYDELKYMEEGTYLRNNHSVDKNVWEKTWRSELPSSTSTAGALNDGSSALFGRLGSGNNPTLDTSISQEIVREWADRQADFFFKAAVHSNSTLDVISEVLRHHGSATGEAAARSVARANMRRAERQKGQESVGRY